MEVLKPEVYWVGNRCYRKNPCKNNYNDIIQSSDTNSSNIERAPLRLPAYEEDMITCDPDAPDESEDMENYQIEKVENGFKTRCETIPPSLFSHIVGAKGATKKRLEYETNTKIIVPRQNEKGDIVVRGQRQKDVSNCRRRLELIASQARFKRDATHFACYPLNFPHIKKKFQEFNEKVIAECGRSCRGLDELILQEPEKVHLTLCVMILLDERERQLCADVLKNLKEEIKEITGGLKLKFQLKGLECMNDDPSEVDILYAKCILEDDKVQRIADLTAKRFVESGFARESKGELVKLHCTVINTRYRSERSGKDEMEEGSGNGSWGRGGRGPVRESFDARGVLEKFGDFDFGMVELQEIQLSTRHTKGNDGFYKAYAQISL